MDKAVATDVNIFSSSTCRTAKTYYHLLQDHILFEKSSSTAETHSNLY